MKTIVCTFTSKGAIDRFTPGDRDCYTAEEVNLVSLPLKKGYRDVDMADEAARRQHASLQL